MLNSTGIRVPYISNGDLSVNNSSNFQGICELSGASGTIKTVGQDLLAPNFKSLGDSKNPSNQIDLCFGESFYSDAKKVIGHVIVIKDKNLYATEAKSVPLIKDISKATPIKTFNSRISDSCVKLKQTSDSALAKITPKFSLKSVHIDATSCDYSSTFFRVLLDSNSVTYKSLVEDLSNKLGVSPSNINIKAELLDDNHMALVITPKFNSTNKDLILSKVPVAPFLIHLSPKNPSHPVRDAQYISPTISKTRPLIKESVSGIVGQDASLLGKNVSKGAASKDFLGHVKDIVIKTVNK